MNRTLQHALKKYSDFDDRAGEKQGFKDHDCR